MRAAATKAEFRRWRLPPDQRLIVLEFRRPVPAGPYVVDFLCVTARVIVEADGRQHGEKLRDQRRDLVAGQGRPVLRFWSHDIPRSRKSVIDAILARAGPP
ncbi:MAG: DUF559 domain-containing protein [Hyphomicrobiales bacterium]|nr:DUF559 domain-containing protein [Hyphomicrobiales bacterium]